MIDWEQTTQHVQHLGIAPGDPLILALFPPKGDSREIGCRYIEVDPDGAFRGRVEQELSRLSNYSLGFLLNPGGTRNEQIEWCRALVYEDDSPTTSRDYKLSQWERCGLLQPSLQVWTGGKSVHNYWVLTQPCTPDEFRRLQKLLFAHISACDPNAEVDTSLSKPAQLLRLAGGIHPSTGDSAVVLTATGERFELEQLESLLTPATAAPSAPIQRHAERGVPYERRTATQKHAVVIEALGFAPQRGEPGSGTYPQARDIVAALVHEFGVDLTLELAAAANWSQEHWEIRAVAESLVDAPNHRKTIWHLFREAQTNGWVCPWPLEREVRTSPSENDKDDPLLLELRQRSYQRWAEARAARFELSSVFSPFIADILGGRAGAFPVADTAMLAPFITTMASVLGKRYVVEPKTGWREPCVFWMGTVAPASSLKTPVANQFLWPLEKLDGQGQHAYKEALQQYRAQPRDTRGNPPALPRQRVVMDATLEGLCTLLERPDVHGVVSFHDELAAFIGDMDKYRKSNSDRAHWLSMWSGGGINILRKGSDPILVERTAVSLFGAIQQDKLTDLLYGDDAAAKSGDGFWSRFLWVSPPYVFPHVNRNEVEINTQLMELVERLDACSKKPIVVTFSDDAWELFASTCDGYSREADRTYASRAAFLGKLRGYLARFAGLLHALDHVTYDGLMDQINRTIPLSVMERAVILTQFFLNQFDVLAPQVGSGDLPGWVVKIVELSKTRETGRVTARDIVTNRWAATSPEARKMLQTLVTDYGLGRLLRTPRKDQTWWDSGSDR